MGNEIVWQPTGYYRNESNIARYMERQGLEEYDKLLPDSRDELVDFWETMADDVGIVWDEEYSRVLDVSEGVEFAEWFVDGELNAVRTVLDRWVETDPERPMFVWEDERGRSAELTYRDVRETTNRVANGMREAGIAEGDRVGVVFPLHPNGIATLLACLRIGAVGVPIFPGYGAEAIRYRLRDSGARLLFVADTYQRGGTRHDIADKVDPILSDENGIEKVVLFENTGTGTIGNAPVESWDDFVSDQPVECPTSSVGAEDPAFIAYTSGTTGDPKGTIQSHSSFLLMGMKDVKYHFDVSECDTLLWITEFGWIIVPIWFLSGAPALGATTVLLQGSPTSPSDRRVWEVIERHDVTTFGISPSGARSFRQVDETPADRHDLSSVRILGSTGEPWDEETWNWWFEEVGGGETPIVNVSGGTELGGNLLGPTPLTPLKPGTLARPAPGVAVNIYDEDGEPTDEGYLVVEQPIPGMTKSLVSGDERYLEEYWSDFEEVWNQNDWAERDEDGFWSITGRADDTMNISGRRTTAPAIEEAITAHPDVREAVVIGYTAEGSGERPIAFVDSERELIDAFREEIDGYVVEKLGGPFKPWRVHRVPGFPRTQTGKVPRGIIESVYEGDFPEDVSTISNTEILEEYPNHTRGDGE